MITIQKGKIFVPKDEELIGFAGDNAHKTVEFLISDSTQENWLYRIYLLFDDGTLNYFVIPALQTQQGTKLTWNVLEEHILKGGIVKMQIKAFCNNSEIYHTNVTTLIVGDSIEFGDGFSKSANAEYLECEKKLNELYGKVVTQNGKPPYTQAQTLIDEAGGAV